MVNDCCQVTQLLDGVNNCCQVTNCCKMYNAKLLFFVILKLHCLKIVVMVNNCCQVLPQLVTVNNCCQGYTNRRV